jgi:hypothetical protein
VRTLEDFGLWCFADGYELAHEEPTLKMHVPDGLWKGDE